MMTPRELETPDRDVPGTSADLAGPAEGDQELLVQVAAEVTRIGALLDQLIATIDGIGASFENNPMLAGMARMLGAGRPAVARPVRPVRPR